MNYNEGENRRQRFRLRLPENAKLKAVIFGQSYDVIEVAEASLCLDARNVRNINGHCSGDIYWSDGSTTLFAGDVGERIDIGRLILNVRGITTSDIVNETRRMIIRFPLLGS